MNKNYDKHREIAIVIFMFVAAILAACAHQAKTSNQTDTTDSCGINDEYYETIDEDTTNDGFPMDSIIQLDDNGNIIKTPLTKEVK